MPEIVGENSPMTSIIFVASGGGSSGFGPPPEIKWEISYFVLEEKV